MRYMNLQNVDILELWDHPKAALTDRSNTRHRTTVCRHCRKFLGSYVILAGRMNHMEPVKWYPLGYILGIVMPLT